MSMRKARCPKCRAFKVKILRANLKSLANTTQATVQCEECGHEWEMTVLTERGKERRAQGRLRV
jgi:uncharacterized Zn finger protein